MYFSHRERHHNNSETRTCISRQGHVRICSHIFLTWSDIETLKSKTLRLNCPRKGHDGLLVLLEVGPGIVADGAERITVTIHTSWDVFRQDSLTPGTLKLPSPKTVREPFTQSKKGETAAGLCPHASFKPEKWQTQLQPHDKSVPCEISIIKDPGSEDSESPWKNSCPLCEMTTTNDAPAIKSKSSQATHQNSCCQCNARYSWTWSSTRSFGCSLHSLKLKTTRQFTVSKPTDPEWLKNLDFKPKGATDPRGDTETKHLLWCDDEFGTFLDWDAVAQWAHKWNGT